MKKTMIIDLISCLYILLFLYTGLFKLVNQNDFKVTLNRQPLLRNYQDIIGPVVPSLEVLIALALLMPFFTHAPLARKWGLRAGTGLMAIFSLYVGYMLMFTRHNLPCSCGGIIKEMNWHQHLYFNCLVTLLGAWAIWLNKFESKSENKDLALS